MKSIAPTFTSLAILLILTGCGSPSSSTSDVSVTQASYDGAKFLLAEEPDGAVGVIEAREVAQDGEPIVIVGRIGGAANPWIEGRAAFMLLDASKIMVEAGEDSSEEELCTEDCCATERAGCTTLVKVVDADGKLVAADARKLLGLANDDMVVVRGKAKKDESDNFTVLADAVHVRREFAPAKDLIMARRFLPWDYGVRNLFRRPSRSALTLGGLSIVVLLVLVVVGFIRGLEASLASTGRPNVMLVYSLSSGADIENSAIPGRTPALLTASVAGVRAKHGVRYVSPELYLGTRIEMGGGQQKGMGLVRGVTTAAPLVRQQVRLSEGRWPAAGEVMAGRLAHSKLGVPSERLAVGEQVEFDGRQWTISGMFSAGGAAYESELWCPLADLQTALKRQDLSLVAVEMKTPDAAADIDIFCHERIDLELKAVRETDYYADLQKHYRPVRTLGWVVVCLVAGSGIFAGLNTMYGAVVGRIRELATLQAIGYRRRAILLTLVQEATLLSCAGALVACGLGLAFVNGTAVRFTMGAFMLRIDSVGIAIGCATAVILGVVGALPPAAKAMRLPVVDAIKAI